MDPLFLLHNSHLEDPDGFASADPQLRRLARLPLVHEPALLEQLPAGQPGIYSIGGARQVGKTTLVKQWMALLLRAGTPPAQIVYFTGELIDDHHSLVRQVRERLSAMDRDTTRYLAIDEVTYTSGWDRGIKFLADAGELECVVLLLTGSDLSVMRDARVRFPGRRGPSAVVDFHLYPLSYREAVRLHRGEDFTTRLVKSQGEVTRADLDVLYEELDLYLQHGGFLPAINDMAVIGSIGGATLRTYADWIRGDMVKRGRHEHYLREVMTAILRRQGSQVTWNALARELSIDHPATVQDYVELLGRMDAVFVQPALREERLGPAPKKARKVIFTDPFIGHAINDWLHPSHDPYKERIIPQVRDASRAGPLVEAVVAMHFARAYPTYYIKAEGEVDIAYVSDGRFFPVEVKWTSQLRPKSLKQLKKYPNSRILARTHAPHILEGIPVEPLPLALLRIEGARASRFSSHG